MKVILNKDIPPLGEEGDIKEVAKGYARNFLFPRRIALPYTERTIKLFEARREAIEERKKLKRQDASSLKERLEALELSITMPAGPNGRLYGAVTSQSVMDEIAKQGFTVERKRIEIPGNTIKSVGKYRFTVKLYGNAAAEMTITIIAQELKPVQKAAPARGRRRSPEEGRVEASAGEAVSGETMPGEPVAVEAAHETPVEAAPSESVAVETVPEASVEAVSEQAASEEAGSETAAPAAE
ncbi:MAG: 50S ribosomal protein L9 [Spirochaetaceae bacterium]|nr:50S ribosomal protein L9 [Spirochaetaceae bacterium]